MLKKTYHTHKETIHNSIWRALQIFGQNGIVFLIFIISAKLLIPYDFGIYNYAIAIVFFLIIFGDFGISTATSKYVAEYNAMDKEKLKSVLFNSGIVILGLTVIITILTLIIGPWYLKEKYIYVLLVLPLIFLVPMTSLYDGVYRGLKRFKSLAIISMCVGAISLSFVYVLIKTYGLIGALISQDLFFIILLIALGLGYREFHFKWNKEVMKEIGSYSFVIGLATLGYFLYSQISTILLGHYGYITEISYYSLLNKLFSFLIIPFSILGQVLAPDNTRIYALGKIDELKQKFKKYLISSLIIGLIISFLLYLVIPLIVNIFFKQYSSTILLGFLQIQIFIFFILISTATVNNGIITPTNYTKWITLSTIIFGIINLPLSILLNYYFSYKGIILSSLISYILNVISMYIIYYKTTFKGTKNEKNNF